MRKVKVEEYLTSARERLAILNASIEDLTRSRNYLANEIARIEKTGEAPQPAANKRPSDTRKRSMAMA